MEVCPALCLQGDRHKTGTQRMALRNEVFEPGNKEGFSEEAAVGALGERGRGGAWLEGWTAEE